MPRLQAFMRRHRMGSNAASAAAWGKPGFWQVGRAGQHSMPWVHSGCGAGTHHITHHPGPNLQAGASFMMNSMLPVVGQPPHPTKPHPTVVGNPTPTIRNFTPHPPHRIPPLLPLAGCPGQPGGAPGENGSRGLGKAAGGKWSGWGGSVGRAGGRAVARWVRTGSCSGCLDHTKGTGTPAVHQGSWLHRQSIQLSTVRTSLTNPRVNLPQAARLPVCLPGLGAAGQPLEDALPLNNTSRPPSHPTTQPPNPLQGLGAAGQPLEGALPLNLMYRDVAVSAVACCNPACACTPGTAEAGLKRRRCAQCLVASYCCRECQRADWGRHKEVCKHLKDM